MLQFKNLNTFDQIGRSLNRTCRWLEASPQRNKARLFSVGLLLPQSTHMHVRLVGNSEVDRGHKACVVNAVSGPNTDTQLSVWGFHWESTQSDCDQIITILTHPKRRHTGLSW